MRPLGLCSLLLLATCAAQPSATQNSSIQRPLAPPAAVGRVNSEPDVVTQSPPGTTEGSVSPAAQFQTPNSLPPGAGTIIRP